jgi:hypothetical protein
MFFAAIYAWGYSRTTPVAARFAARLLGGAQAEDDSKLALHAKNPVVEKQVRRHYARASLWESLQWGHNT